MCFNWANWAIWIDVFNDEISNTRTTVFEFFVLLLLCHEKLCRVISLWYFLLHTDIYQRYCWKSCQIHQESFFLHIFTWLIRYCKCRYVSQSKHYSLCRSVHIYSGWDTIDYTLGVVLQCNKIIKMSLIYLAPHMNAITQIRMCDTVIARSHCWKLFWTSIWSEYL